ncbi:MAG: hypothetical protein IJ870_01165 [Alphaproteobacteria bacterium]|nr:hypothetical protein [Alphaproteobacteria bacterium]
MQKKFFSVLMTGVIFSTGALADVSQYYYNEKGLLTKKCWTTDCSSYVSYEYDDQDRLVSETDGGWSYKYTYQDNAVMQRDTYRNGVKSETYFFKQDFDFPNVASRYDEGESMGALYYDSNGNITGGNLYSVENGTVYKTDYTNGVAQTPEVVGRYVHTDDGRTLETRYSDWRTSTTIRDETNMKGLGYENIYEDGRKEITNFDNGYERPNVMTYYPDGSFEGRMHILDEYGNPISYTQYNKDGTSLIEIAFDNVYDNGKLISQTLTFDNGQYQVVEYYDDGTRKSEKNYDKDGVLQSEVSFDEHGNDIYFTSNDGQYSEFSHEYDKQGNLLKTTFSRYDQDGKLISEGEESCDSWLVKQIGFGMMDRNCVSIKDIGYDADGNVMWGRYWEFDEYGNPLQEMQYQNNQPVAQRAHVYANPNWKAALKALHRKIRRSYTLEEAAAASKPTGNTFRLRYK